MSKKIDPTKSMLVFELDPTECPFREFRDNELGPEFWGLGPAAFRATLLISKAVSKPPADFVWVDDQTQPLPRSVRQYLHGWVRAEDLALRRWEAEVMVFEENNGSGKISVIDMQLSHAQVLLRSSFCRNVLSHCFILERVESLATEHQWENFVFSFAPEGWRARYHIYSPGVKPGGGPQHRPGLSKNGCYLVRLYYLGAWRCVWVSDQVPVDATDSPLLPFSPLLTATPPKAAKQPPAMATMPVVQLWPLLICKALLKLAAPDMNSDEDLDCWEDELMEQFDIQHALTGGMNLTYHISDAEVLWDLITTEVPVFSWDEDDDTLTSTIRSKSTKKPTTKEVSVVRRSSLTTLLLEDTKNKPPYALPGITPGHEMNLLVTMARDLPLKKPLPEPDVALWKHYRWVDWARRHGLYEAFDCPRTRYLKVNGLLKLSHAPHLLDVQSTESITFQFREEHDKTNPPLKKVGGKEMNRSMTANSTIVQQAKEELREWLQYNAIQEVVKSISIVYYPSMFQYTSVASSPPTRVTKAPVNRALDIPAPKFAPIYLQVDGPDENILRISLSTLHPRILMNSGVHVVDHIESAYLILEVFEWFVNCDLPLAKAFVSTRGYDTVEVKFQPGRHVCRLWVHSRMNWHGALLSESTLLLGSRDTILCAAVRECPWASRFLTNLGSAFNNWIRVVKSSTNMVSTDREFYSSYQPDLEWDEEVVGYDIHLRHWMFRQALQAVLKKKLSIVDFRAVCPVLRRYFCDPDFGLPNKPLPTKSLRDIATADPCDCVMPETEEVEIFGEQVEEQVGEERPLVSPSIMDQLLSSPIDPNSSKVCELATEELPCGLLKDEREKVIQRHEAATVIQAHWRGTWARKCLSNHAFFTPEALKLVMENAFGNLEALSALMNKFFEMYPSTKRAYSLSSALTGLYGVQQHSGTIYVTPKCKWIPFFQGVFHCHAPVQAHLDVQSSLAHSTLAVYNNDSGDKMPQVYNAHITFDFKPNDNGYTVMGHGSLFQASGTNFEAHWQVTVLSSIANMFHVCDNEIEGCKEQPLPHSSKLHIDEIFIPNRRNILGGIEFLVTKHEIISFRAASTSEELEMEAILRTTSSQHEVEEVARCSGKGELYWPYIRLEPTPPLAMSPFKKRSNSQAYLGTSIRESTVHSSARSLRNARPAKPSSANPKTKSTTKLKDLKAAFHEPKHYSIQVIAPHGWPLTLAQWSRVDEIRNSPETMKLEAPSSKKPAKEKPGSAKEKEKLSPPPMHQPQPGDAYVELECSLAVMGGSNARRDDVRDLEFAAARRAWDAKDHGRNARGAQIRKDFRAEFLEALPPPPSESERTIAEEMNLGEELEGEEKKVPEPQPQQGPTPATESGMLEMSIESEEEARYLAMPEQLKDKFVSLYFIPFCTKEKTEEESILITEDMAEASRRNREFRIEKSQERKRELQAHNEEFVLGRQKKRCRLLEKLFIDSQWSEELTRVLEERDEAIAREALNRTLSATKKKQEAKKK
ncbi:uncharacterized protein [Epargyreus clarus]|uniref:uncharacterized protein n=1 Tax=Epargyreus clarus TaxID=520877 RepID=UPI003C2E8866